VRTLVEELRSRAGGLRGAAIVAGSDTDPAKIANPHMRAHASEGRLFPDLVEEALAACGLDCRRLVERELHGAAGKALGLPSGQVTRALAAMGRRVGPPWRAQEKAAALAAWMLLARGTARR
jgi:hypothetical protein